MSAGQQVLLSWHEQEITSWRYGPRSIFDRGARPWRFARTDYIDAVDRLPAASRPGLNGRTRATPWDEELCAAMTAADVAAQDELTADGLLSGLR